MLPPLDVVVREVKWTKRLLDADAGAGMRVEGSGALHIAADAIRGDLERTRLLLGYEARVVEVCFGWV